MMDVLPALSTNVARIVQLLITVLLLTSMQADGSEFSQVTTCDCVGYNTQYECAVDGGVATKWRLSVLGCEILLRHSQFDSPSETLCRTCSNQVYACVVTALNNTFTSQLFVNISQNLHGESVECIKFDESGDTTIGTDTISVNTSPPPPDNLTLESVSPSQLLFSWSDSTYYENCPSLQYNIFTSNCGQCPTTTGFTNVTCTGPGVTVSGQQRCTMTVQTMVCGDNRGTNTVPLLVLLKAATVDNVVISPVYGQTKLLTKIHLNFDLPEPYYISDGIDGSPTMYTVDFIDVHSGTLCDSGNYSNSSCTGGSCINAIDVSLLSSCPYSTDITVEITPSNVLGRGITTSIHIGVINRFVDPEFDIAITRSVMCKFLGQNTGSIKSCKIEYGPEQSCPNMVLSSQGDPSATDSVVVGISLLNNVSRYCYLLTASNGTVTVAMTGIFTTACNPAHLTDGGNTEDGVQVCGPSYTTMAIKNGIVCYSGTGIGSTAVYFCRECGYKRANFETSLIRTCMESGQWNGSTPQCSCGGLFTAADVGLYSGITAVLMFIPFTITTISLLYCLCAINKERVRIRREYENERAMKIYEEITCLDQVGGAHIDTNVAYVTSSCVKESSQ